MSEPVDGMLEVIIDSIRVGLRNLRRVLILREKDSERYLVIWIAPDLADAITSPYNARSPMT